jgi:hypothetical protein
MGRKGGLATAAAMTADERRARWRSAAAARWDTVDVHAASIAASIDAASIAASIREALEREGVPAASRRIIVQRVCRRVQRLATSSE